MASVLNALRGKVSQDRVRFRDGVFDLDLTYITPRIIAMGLPSSGVEAVYRNRLADVATFLDLYHGPGRYMVWNLSERSYDYSKFQYNVQEFGWLDHHAPPLRKLVILCQLMQNWLAANPRNVVVVHCKAGKGRTGVAVVSYLLHAGFMADPITALAYFGKMRTEDAQGGVQHPSQRRYVHYFHNLLQNDLPQPCPLRLVKIILRHGVPNIDGRGCRLFFSIYQGNKRFLFSNKKRARSYSIHNNVIVLPVPGVQLHGDTLVVFRHLGMLGPSTIFRFNFHTGLSRHFLPVLIVSSFVRNGKYLYLRKRDLDLGATDGRIPVGFTVELVFEPVGATPVDKESRDAAALKQWPWMAVHESYMQRRIVPIPQHLLPPVRPGPPSKRRPTIAAPVPREGPTEGKGDESAIHEQLSATQPLQGRLATSGSRSVAPIAAAVKSPTRSMTLLPPSKAHMLDGKVTLQKLETMFPFLFKKRRPNVPVVREVERITDTLKSRKSPSLPDFAVLHRSCAPIRHITSLSRFQHKSMF